MRLRLSIRENQDRQSPRLRRSAGVAHQLRPAGETIAVKQPLEIGPIGQPVSFMMRACWSAIQPGGGVDDEAARFQGVLA